MSRYSCNSESVDEPVYHPFPTTNAYWRFTPSKFSFFQRVHLLKWAEGIEIIHGFASFHHLYNISDSTLGFSLNGVHRLDIRNLDITCIGDYGIAPFSHKLTTKRKLMKQYLIYMPILFICITYSNSFSKIKNTTPLKSTVMDDQHIVDYLNTLHKLSKIKNVNRMHEIITQANKNGIF